MTIAKILLLAVCFGVSLALLLTSAYLQAGPVQKGSRCVEIVSAAPVVVKVGVVVNGQCSILK